MRLLKIVLLAAITCLGISSCTEETKPTDTLGSGKIDISVDETYRPVIEQQLRVFDSSFPEAKVTAHYKPEAECFKDYFDNKARIILVTRELSKEEKALCEQKQIFPSGFALAKDAVAVIVNKERADTMDVDEVRGILTGTYKTKYTVVFDNQGSSTVRYITDSLLKGQKLGNNVFAAKGNKEVVGYVAKNPDAIGFVGLGYVASETDSNNTGAFTDKVKVVAVKNERSGNFYKPYQAYIGIRDYPLTRNLYYVSRESYAGLGTGFANFLASTRGQLIFAHASLFPLRMSVAIRDAEISH